MTSVYLCFVRSKVVREGVKHSGKLADYETDNSMLAVQEFMDRVLNAQSGKEYAIVKHSLVVCNGMRCWTVAMQISNWSQL